MRRKSTGLLLASLILGMSIHAQQKPAAKPVTTKPKTTQPAKPAVNKPAPPAPPPVVLTPAEIKKATILNTCRQLIQGPIVNYSFFASEERSLNFGLDSLVYEVAEAGLARVKLKNEKQHTLYRFDITYDSVAARITEITVFSPKELSETEYDGGHKKYKIVLDNRLVFHYLSDSLTQILQYRPPYTEPQYSWELKNTADSVVLRQFQYDNRRIFITAFLNRKTGVPDSSTFHTYSSFTPYTPELHGTNYYQYSNGRLDAFMLYGENKRSYQHYRKVYDSAGKMVQLIYTMEKSIYSGGKDHVWTGLKRDSITGLVKQKDVYSFMTGDKDELPERLPEGQEPSTENYIYSGQPYVTQVTSLYETKCITKKVTTDYTLDSDGFVIEFITKSDIKDRCR